jgi:hypothetical protein
MAGFIIEQHLTTGDARSPKPLFQRLGVPHRNRSICDAVMYLEGRASRPEVQR